MYISLYSVCALDVSNFTRVQRLNHQSQYADFALDVSVLTWVQRMKLLLLIRQISLGCIETPLNTQYVIL